MNTLQSPHKRVSLTALAGFAALCFVFLSCQDSTGTVDGELRPVHFTNVRDAEARWRARNISSYSLLQQRVCFCIFGANVYRVTVQNGAITSIADTTTKQELHADLRASFLSVDGLFDEIRKLEAQRNDRLEIAYDSLFGYPRLISVDISRNIADEEYTIITNLEIKP